jgi:hypothetical protein
VTHFTAEIFRIDEPGGWHFVRIPDDLAPDSAGAWGRAPVIASVDGRTWSTSAWRDSTRGWLLPVPKKIRGDLHEGDTVRVTVEVDHTRSLT